MDEKLKMESHTSAAAFVEGGIQDACDDSCSICLEAFCDSDPSTVYIILPICLRFFFYNFGIDPLTVCLMCVCCRLMIGNIKRIKGAPNYAAVNCICE